MSLAQIFVRSILFHEDGGVEIDWSDSEQARDVLGGPVLLARGLAVPPGHPSMGEAIRDLQEDAQGLVELVIEGAWPKYEEPEDDDEEGITMG